MLTRRHFRHIAALLTLSLCLTHSTLGDTDQKSPGWIDVHIHLGALGQEGMQPSGPSQRGGDRMQSKRDRRGGPPSQRGGSRGYMSSKSDFEAAADALVNLMDDLGVKHAMVVLVPVPEHRPVTNEQEMRLILAGVHKHPDRLHLMGGGSTLTPMMEETPPENVTPAIKAAFRKEAERLLDEEGAVGFGEMLVLHASMQDKHSYSYYPADHPLFLLLADIAADRGVPIDIHMEATLKEMPTPQNLRRASRQNPDTLPASIPAFETLLAHNRGATIVWQHIGWDNLGTMTPELIRQLLTEHGNLYIALRVEQRPYMVGGGRTPMPNRIVDRTGRIDPDWMRILEEFPDRVMIGSDEFVSKDGSPKTPIASFRDTWAILNQLPPDLALMIGRSNAARIYGLE